MGKRILFFANKVLPQQDYRVDYALRCNRTDICLAMPGNPAGIDGTQYLEHRIGEGVAFSDVLEFARLFAFLRKHRASISANHFFSTKFVLAGPLLSRLAGIPSLVTITGYGRIFNEDKPIYRVLRVIYFCVLYFSLRYTRLVLFQNRGDMDFLARRFPSFSNRFRLIGSAVDFAPVFKDKYTGAEIHVLCVSRLQSAKGVYDFLEVARRLHKERFSFTLIGPKSKGEDDLFKDVLALNASGVIRYPGERHAGELRTMYRDSHVFFFPSYGEGLPRVMIEAGMAGLCPVAYDINANLDLVPDEQHGFLVKKGDTDAAVSVLYRLKGDRDLMHAAAAAYQKHMMDNYSLDAYRGKMDECLRIVTGNTDS